MRLLVAAIFKTITIHKKNPEKVKQMMKFWDWHNSNGLQKLHMVTIQHDKDVIGQVRMSLTKFSYKNISLIVLQLD
jgi:cytochrome b561